MENPAPTTEAVAKATVAPTHPKSAPAPHSLNVANSTSSALLEYHAAMVKKSFFFFFPISSSQRFLLIPTNHPPSSSSILICNKIIAPSAVTSIKQFKHMCAESGLSANCCALPVVSFHFWRRSLEKRIRRKKGKGKGKANDDWDIRLVRIFFVTSCKM